jgi:mRNA interferase RelE/StbE
MYKVSWSKRARESLKKLDAVIAQKIVDKVENYLVKDPVNLGEPLLYAYKGLYRYRFSDYRVIYQVKQTELLIIVLEAGHRKEIYK